MLLKYFTMKKKITNIIVLLLITGFSALAQNNNSVAVNQLVIVANHPGPVISKDIYGHFS